jgi:hypothetical protein
MNKSDTLSLASRRISKILADLGLIEAGERVIIKRLRPVGGNVH